MVDNHAFPLPFIDWYYTADQLVVGGLMIIDDIQLITGRLLADFMDADPKWERVLYEERRFAVFRKVQHPIHKGGWTGQPYVVDSNPVHQINILTAAPAPGSRPAYKALVAVCAPLSHSAQALIVVSAGLFGRSERRVESHSQTEDRAEVKWAQRACERLSLSPW